MTKDEIMKYVEKERNTYADYEPGLFMVLDKILLKLKHLQEPTEREVEIKKPKQVRGKCPVCGFNPAYYHKYCPNCGKIKWID